MDDTLKSYRGGTICTGTINGFHRVHDSIHIEAHDAYYPGGENIKAVDCINRDSVVIILCSTRHNRHLDRKNPALNTSENRDISPVGLRNFVLTERGFGWIHPARLETGPKWK